MDKLPIVIAEFEKNGRETVRVVLEDYKGTTIIAARVRYRDHADELRPGRSGIGMAVKHLPALADAFSNALVCAREQGLLPDGDQ